MNMKFLSVMAVLAATSALAGCQSSRDAFPGLTSKAPARKVMAQQAEIKSLMPIAACASSAMAGKRVALSPSKDSTGKTNSVADAGTGNFLPGDQTARAAIPVLRAAGATVMDLSAASTGESVLRQMVSDRKLESIKRVTDRSMPYWYLDFASLTADFDRTSNFSLMFKGFGGYSDSQRATISGGAMLVKADGSRTVDGNGDMKVSVFSTQSGFMLGKVVGNGLATGEAGVGFQQPMQLWTKEFIVPLTTVIAMTDMPAARHCRPMLDKIVPRDLVDM